MAHESDALDANEEFAKTEMSGHLTKDASIAPQPPTQRSGTLKDGSTER
jgi:hypothetical protein